MRIVIDTLQPYKQNDLEVLRLLVKQMERSFSAAPDQQPEQAPEAPKKAPEKAPAPKTQQEPKKAQETPKKAQETPEKAQQAPAEEPSDQQDSVEDLAEWVEKVKQQATELINAGKAAELKAALVKVGLDRVSDINSVQRAKTLYEAIS